MIENLGEQAVKLYHHALSEGTKKIPYCSLLILGRGEGGKTNLLRQLVALWTIVYLHIYSVIDYIGLQSLVGHFFLRIIFEFGP